MLMKKKWSNSLNVSHTNSNLFWYQGFVANGDGGVLGTVGDRTIGAREVVFDVSFERGASFTVGSLIFTLLSN